jgi:hypothetical protein
MMGEGNIFAIEVTGSANKSRFADVWNECPLLQQHGTPEEWLVRF